MTSRSTSATITPSILRYLLLVMSARGVDLRPVLNTVDLHQDLMRPNDLRVSYRQGTVVIRRALDLAADTGLGLAVGCAQHPTAWGLLGFALMASDTLRDAMAVGVRYQNTFGAMVVWSLDHNGGGFALRTDLPDPGVDPEVGVFLVDEGIASVITLTRLILGPSFAPRLVELAFPRPPHADHYSDVFGCPVRFDAEANRTHISATWARHPMPDSDPWTLAGTLALLDQGASPRRQQQDLLEGLENEIALSLPEVPSFTDQARRHSASERTLRRRLADCGTTYEAVVDGVRRERVEYLLGRSDLTLREIARQVGFADERTLRRAVTRWHHTSPSLLRKTLTA